MSAAYALSTSRACIKSKVGLLQTAHSWANAGVLFGAAWVGALVLYENGTRYRQTPLYQYIKHNAQTIVGCKFVKNFR